MSEDTVVGGDDVNDELELDEQDEGDDTVEGGDGDDTTEGGADTVAGDTVGGGDAPAGRGATRIQALAKRARDAEDRATRAEAIAAERDRPRDTAPRGQTPDEARRAREEKLSTMDPLERAQFETKEQLENMQQQVMQTRVQTQDLLDKNSYAAEAKANPVFAKHKDEVEKRYLDGCRAGVWFPREKYLAVVIGEAALKAKPNTKEKEQARQRVDSAKGNPPAGRSNVSTGRARGEKTFEELEQSLENVTF